MKTMYKFIWMVFIPAFFSCKKDWLDAKPNKNLVVPVTLADLQALLDNNIFVFNHIQPALGEIGCDDYYVRYDDWKALYTNTERNAYIWAKDIYNNEPVIDWMSTYQRVFYENYVLENIDNITTDEGNIAEWQNIKGSALFG